MESRPVDLAGADDCAGGLVREPGDAAGSGADGGPHSALQRDFSEAGRGVSEPAAAGIEWICVSVFYRTAIWTAREHCEEGQRIAVLMRVDDTSGADASATMQLAAARLALNLHEAGFNVQVAAAGSRQTPALILRRVHLEAMASAAGAGRDAGAFGQNGSVTGTDAARCGRRSGGSGQ